MRQRSPVALIAILALAVVALWVDLEFDRGTWYRALLFWRPEESRELKIPYGLDLQGGLEVLMQANLGPGQTPTAADMEAARVIVTKRVNGLGVSEPLIQLLGSDRIAIQLPGVRDPDLAIRTFGQTGLLEFVDTGDVSLPEGTKVTTTGFNPNDSGATSVPTATVPGPTVAPTRAPASATPALAPTAAAVLTGTPTVSPTGEITTTPPLTSVPPLTTTPTLGPYRTILTGVHIESAQFGRDPTTREAVVQFTLKADGSRIFADHTTRNIGKFLTIVLDKEVISSPSIRNAITGGSGVISGSFTQESAQALAVQIRYGALPVPLKVLSSRAVGPTLGQESINHSITAAMIGVGAVVIFMILYYRVPGVLATLALTLYGLLVFAIFKLVPITLTLAGIAGFILSIGMAVDANILIFERMKEELRSGRSPRAAIRAGFDRAWLSIRDSNVSSLITCAILFVFGSNFGASIVAGFAITLAIGILVSLFTAIFVTRTLMNHLMDLDLVQNHWWLGVSGKHVAEAR